MTPTYEELLTGSTQWRLTHTRMSECCCLITDTATILSGSTQERGYREVCDRRWDNKGKMP